MNVMAESWDQLPILIVVNIFKYLQPQDRINAASTCQLWTDALYSPFLWRNLLVPFATPFQDIFCFLARQFGCYMNKLELVWECPKNLYKVSEEFGHTFLKVLVAEDVQLKKLILTRWDSLHKAHNKNRLINTLNEFLSYQLNLEELSLLNSSLKRDEVLHILSAACYNNRILKKLDLRGAFRGWRSPYPAPQYLIVLNTLPNLTTLLVDYRSLCDEVLNTMATSTPLLVYLQINIYPADSSLFRHLAISDVGWQNLRSTCPKLQVSFVVVNISYFEDTSCFLLASVPLHKFYFYSGTVWDHTRSRNFRGTVKRLLDFYTDSLEDVRLTLKNNRECLDDLLLDLYQSCYKLKHLQFDGIVQNLEVLHTMCHLELAFAPRFNSIKIAPRVLNAHNRFITTQLIQQFESRFTSRHVNFFIEDPFPVLYFY